MANIIDDIATLLSRAAEQMDTQNTELVDALDAGNGIDCIVNSIYVNYRGYEVLEAGNNTDQENEDIADKMLKEFDDGLPGSATVQFPSFTLQTS